MKASAMVSQLLFLVLILTNLSSAGDRTWSWTVLNATLQGRLHAASPLAQPCFSHYDGRPVSPQPSQCSELQAQYTTAAYRADLYNGFMHAQNEICAASSNPITSQCLLDPSNPTDLAAVLSHSCGQGSVSRYYIPVHEAADVQTAFEFARHTGVALSVKNSGHDFSSRSSLHGSLALWTRPLQNLAFHPEFIPEGCPIAPSASHPAITLGAGVNFDQVYRFAHQNNVTFIGGTAPTVGASGGLAMTGGHGLLSAQFGLGIDRILEYQIVTPDGQVRRANACQNTDLFWALRGGGGGTYGVVLESTSSVEPRLPLVFAYLTVPANVTHPDAFAQLLMEHAVRWSQQGWGGPNSMNSLVMANPFLNLAAARASLAEAIDYVKAQPGGTVVFESYPDFFPVYEAYMLPTANAGVGQARFATNRLIPTAMLQNATGRARILDTLNQLVAEGYKPTLFATPPSDIHSPYTDPGSTSATPAWRNSTWMITTEAQWPWNSTLTQRRAFVRRLKAVTRALERLAPDSGSYISEADPFTDNWKTSWWGENYAELLRIKQKYDPDGLLRCWRCVGWDEQWEQPGGRFDCLGGLLTN
ncbi:FAD-binding domain-containing protein [Aspergillus sclerotioniger CBS 115572]|uniref:FAD-binding domain-containing protein n=1 Tax=Aspergillus sclerotioniger CBS 115572 TaxID=1450535 RepID=A0A317VSP9_9EURO|nr:FAD-binding domain-containing protein [Aspergillus sclerotioniger CBS 115572]PWY76057.1 FAD-binding domain-containing protein [Aspergillus sclerotioniger CBS 115572]